MTIWKTTSSSSSEPAVLRPMIILTSPVWSINGVGEVGSMRRRKSIHWVERRCPWWVSVEGHRIGIQVWMSLTTSARCSKRLLGAIAMRVPWSVSGRTSLAVLYLRVVRCPIIPTSASTLSFRRHTVCQAYFSLEVHRDSPKTIVQIHN